MPVRGREKTGAKGASATARRKQFKPERPQSMLLCRPRLTVQLPHEAELSNTSSRGGSCRRGAPLPPLLLTCRGVAAARAGLAAADVTDATSATG